MGAVEEDLEAFRVVGARVGEMKAERAWLTAGTDFTKAECENLAARICKLELAAATNDGDLRVMVPAVRTLGVRSVEGKDRVEATQVRARKRSGHMSELGALVEGYI